MEKTKSSPKQAPSDSRKKTKASTAKDSDHKNMHPEVVIPEPTLRERPDVLPQTRIDDDPESYRLT